MPKVGVAAHPIHAEKFQVPEQVNDDVAHAHAHLDFSDWLGEPDEYDIEDEWNKMDDCPDHTAVHGVEMSPPETQNHPDYIPSETNLHKCPLSLSNEQLKPIYQECFDGIGKFKDYKYHIGIEENAKPVFRPTRKVTLALQSKLKKELESLVEQSIITPVEGPTNWADSLVVRENLMVDKESV